MNWLLSIFISLLSGALGLVAAGFIMSLCVDWYRISSFEGKSGYAVVAVGLLGGVAGLVIGLLAARIVAAGAEPGFLKALGVAWGLVLGIALAALALCRLGADLAPRMDGRELEIEIEVRCPKGFQPPEPDPYGATTEVYLPRGRRLPSARLRLDQTRTENGRFIVPAAVPLTTSSSRKFLNVRFNVEYDLMFNLPLASHPSARDLEWSRWNESAWDARKPAPPKEAMFNLRYRVRTIEPAPPPPAEAEIEAQQEAEAQAKFEAIPPDASIGTWISYTQPGMNGKRSAAALQRITGRSGFVVEMNTLMLDPDPKQAAEALLLVGRLPQPYDKLIPGVREAGLNIIERMRGFNAMPPEQNPRFEGAADVAVRFSGWMAAVRALREKNGDNFIPQLREILELSRVRTDSQLMQSDIRRVASYYLKLWAGVEPLPDDPPPR